MPVTAVLSKKFYETFGEEVTNELVNWFNAVDATYRSQLRDINEANFARFEAKLGERLAELDTKWSDRWNQLDAKWGERWNALDAVWTGRWADLDTRLIRLSEQVSDRLRKTETRLTALTIAWVPTVLGIYEFLIRR